MSQYQRLISYLYRYEENEKKNNVGYARIELRGDSCRITVQMRDYISGLLPEVAFFRQEPEGTKEIRASRLKKNGNGFGCRIETRVDNMVNSGYSFSDLDGLVIFVSGAVYYATTWKDITVSFHHSFKEEQLEAAGEAHEETGQADTQPVDSPAGDMEQPAEHNLSDNGEAGRETGDNEEYGISESTGRDGQDALEQDNEAGQGQEVHLQQTGQQRDGESGSEEVSGGKDANTVAACQYEACCQCPQRGRMGDFGSHILAMFPRMYPFEIESIKECVRLELKDIGCLPVPYWSLSGNPVLLHGYYCYRHILFTKVSDGGYYIGVPGIYNRENERQARCCGFREFKTLSEVADRQGAFGYWMYPVMA